MGEERKGSFWSTLPGILTGVAAVVSAVTGVLIATGYASKLSSGGSAAPPGAASSGTAASPASWPIVGDEPFLSADSGWYTGRWDDDYWARAELAIVSGKYRWDLEARRNAMRYQESPFGPAVNFHAAVDVSFVSGTSNKEFAAGLMFGRESKRYYAFQVSNYGKYRLSRTVDADTTNVINWTPIPTDKRGVTRVAISVDDQHIQLFVNSKLVGDFRDPEFFGGKVGLTAVNFDPGSSQVVDFDNFEFRRKPAN